LTRFTLQLGPHLVDTLHYQQQPLAYLTFIRISANPGSRSADHRAVPALGKDMRSIPSVLYR